MLRHATALAAFFTTLHAAWALQCYDCMSPSHHWCVDAAERNSVTGHLFDVVQCPADEPYCSVLVGTVNGQELVTRQCARDQNDQEDIRQLLERAIGRRVHVEAFEVCASDRCNSGAARDRYDGYDGYHYHSAATALHPPPALPLLLLLPLLALPLVRELAAALRR